MVKAKESRCQGKLQKDDVEVDGFASACADSPLLRMSVVPKLQRAPGGCLLRIPRIPMTDRQTS